MSLGLSKFSNEPSLHARSLPIKKRGVSISHSCSSVRINAVPKLSCMPETHKRNKSYVDPEEGLGVRTTRLENHKAIGFLRNTGPEFLENHKATMGAQWLSGRVLDSRPRGRGFEPHRRHCVVVIEQDTFILA